VKLRVLQESDLPAVLALQHRLAPERRKMSMEIMHDSFFAASHDFGKNTCAVMNGDELVGAAGWVKGDTGEFFGAPVLTGNAEAAALLFTHLLEQAQGSKWMRASCFPEENEKRRAFEERGFKPEFDFVEFEIAPSTPNAPKLPIGVTEGSLTQADPAQFMALSNLSFAGVDNTLPMDLDDAKETLSSPLRDARLSLLWKNSVGNYVAFAIVNTDGYLDAIGVHPEQQKLGYGALLYKRLLAFAAEKKLARIFTTVSSRNYGSLRLHAKLGIPEVERRTVYQRNL